MTDRAQQARDFALDYHGDQQYGDAPYAVHLDAVAELVSSYGEDALVVAYLHDVLEDTEAELADLAAEFGAFIAQCVSVLTDEPGDTRQLRKRLTWRKMSKVSGKLELALLVKAADRLANVRACLADANQPMLKRYREEHPQLKASAYRPGLCDLFWEELDRLLG
jgi:guanosine-3',5'-bis(diphosphate) 3'-pyrophosphohydrolase